MAFEAVFKLYYQELCRLAYSILKDRGPSEEIVQDVFLKVWDKRNKLEVKTSLKSYLYSSVRNSCFNYIKHLKIEREYADKQENNFYSFDATEDKVAGNELNHAINKALEELPEKRREVFELSRFEGMKYNEIAAHLNISVKTVEAQMGHALAFLRGRLREFLVWVSVFFNFF